ncbi:signal peptidase I [Naasia sp. SYSU D00057]|uniref:signal peptidase I n=1 Tax=Naasia sp. SYSU D00057 TaxID=2817380 RepID=UPI001B30DD4D|nr:signal peptidase I [Naasia sp. SYSU D00057]
MTAPPEQSTREKHGVWRALRLGLGWGLLALVAGLGIAAVGVPAVTGSTPLAVLTGSMEPKLPVGTLVVVRPTPPEQIRLGDVITYQLEPGQPAVVSHRVIEVHSISDGRLEFVTQGDNNSAPDATPVQAAQVKGTVWYSLPLVGWASIAVGHYGVWLAPLVGIGLLAYAAVLIGGSLLGRARAAKAGPAPLAD